MADKKRTSGKLFELQFLISVAFTIVALVGIVFVGGALYIPFYQTSLNMIKDDHHQIIEQVNLNIDGYLRSMMRISDSVYYKIIKNADFADTDIQDKLSLLYDVNVDRLVSIGIFSDRGEKVAATPISNVKSTVSITEQDWFIQAKTKIENLHFSNAHVQNIFENTDLRYRWVITLSRSVDLTYNGNINYGVLFVDMNLSGIEQICRKARLGEMGYVYITDSKGEIIYHPNQQLIFSNLYKENISAAMNYDDGGYLEKFDGRQRFVTVKTVGYTGWKIIGVSYVEEVMPLSNVAFFAVIIITIAIFIMSQLNQYVSSRIANPIKQLQKSVDEIDRGRLDVQIEVSGSAEVQHLGHAINRLLAQIRSLMDEVVLEQEQKLKSELNALQSQINPHFLYNALDSVVWMIETGVYDKAVVMVTSISRLFRIGISRGDNIITIGAEIEHAKNYLTIQNIRFKNKFAYEISLPEELKDYQTIKLIVQPIIENAIYHGMEFMDGDGLIKIDARLEGENLLLEISDNGLGIPEDVADTLLRAPSESTKSSGIGLYNVQKRIQLYFGNDYGLKIDSEPDVGTSITITLPAVKYRGEGGNNEK